MNIKKEFSRCALILAFCSFGSFLHIAGTQNSVYLSDSSKQISYSMKNPVAGISREEAWECAISLGSGRNCGSYKTMSAKEFMEWWASSNNETLNELDYQKIGYFVSMKNPVAGISREEAWERAISLGSGRDCGSYKTMSAGEFMEWWASSNNETLTELEKFIFF